jgi:hypothetical protein
VGTLVGGHRRDASGSPRYRPASACSARSRWGSTESTQDRRASQTAPRPQTEPIRGGTALRAR